MKKPETIQFGRLLKGEQDDDEHMVGLANYGGEEIVYKFAKYPKPMDWEYRIYKTLTEKAPGLTHNFCQILNLEQLDLVVDKETGIALPKIYHANLIREDGEPVFHRVCPTLILKKMDGFPLTKLITEQRSYRILNSMLYQYLATAYCSDILAGFTHHDAHTNNMFVVKERRASKYDAVYYLYDPWTDKEVETSISKLSNPCHINKSLDMFNKLETLTDTWMMFGEQDHLLPVALCCEGGYKLKIMDYEFAHVSGQRPATCSFRLFPLLDPTKSDSSMDVIRFLVTTLGYYDKVYNNQKKTYDKAVRQQKKDTTDELANQDLKNIPGDATISSWRDQLLDLVNCLCKHGTGDLRPYNPKTDIPSFDHNGLTTCESNPIARYFRHHLFMMELEKQDLGLYNFLYIRLHDIVSIILEPQTSVPFHNSSSTAPLLEDFITFLILLIKVQVQHLYHYIYILQELVKQHSTAASIGGLLTKLGARILFTEQEVGTPGTENETSRVWYRKIKRLLIKSVSALEATLQQYSEDWDYKRQYRQFSKCFTPFKALNWMSHLYIPTTTPLTNNSVIVWIRKDKKEQVEMKDIPKWQLADFNECNNMWEKSIKLRTIVHNFVSLCKVKR